MSLARILLSIKPACCSPFVLGLQFLPTESGRTTQSQRRSADRPSIFTIAHLRQAIEAVEKDEIATNQVEKHPLLQNRKLVDFARQQGIHLTGYMPLAYGKVLAEPDIQRIPLPMAPARRRLPWPGRCSRGMR